MRSLLMLLPLLLVLSLACSGPADSPRPPPFEQAMTSEALVPEVAATDVVVPEIVATDVPVQTVVPSPATPAEASPSEQAADAVPAPDDGMPVFPGVTEIPAAPVVSTGASTGAPTEPRPGNEGSLDAPQQMLPEDARDLFNRAVIATGAVSSYRYHMEVEFQASGAGDAGNMVITMDGRFLAPDRNALEMTVSFGFISMNVSTVSIGDDLYTMNPFTGEWSLERIPLLGSASAPWMLIEEDFLEGLRYVGLEELDSGPAHRLSATPDPENAVLDWQDLFLPPEAESILVHYWIGQQDLLFQRVQMFMTQRDGMVPTPVSIVIDFSDYGADLVVERPVQSERAKAGVVCDILLRDVLATEPGTVYSGWVDDQVARVQKSSDGCSPDIWSRQATDWSADNLPRECFTELRDVSDNPFFTVGDAVIPAGLTVDDDGPVLSTMRDEAGNMLIYWVPDILLLSGGTSCWLYLVDDQSWYSNN